MPPWSKPLSLFTLAAVALAGCGDSGPQFPPPCPSLSLLRDAADISRFTGPGQDLSEQVLQARIAAVPASCAWGSQPGQVKATLRVTFDVTRGPAANSRVLSAPYFVAVTKGSTVLDEQDYELSAKFPPNIDHAQFTSDKVDLVLPVTDQQSAAAYQIYVGFRLSPAELQANRQHRP